MTLPLGSKLGSYEVLSLLGAGGMGEVYRARDTRLGRVVAIKVLPAERMADENRRRRFVQEARAASALNHPNIVTIHEIESADGNDFIVMEYVPGMTLHTLIPRQGMRVGEVLRIAIPIADAVARAHAAGIAHRDLKPANVVVGSDGVVKVLDFGLAKLVTEEEADSPKRETRTEVGDAGALSRPGTVAGTVEYMSPEQATGRKVDARSDVFSFGAMLYEMVTGRRAFAGNSTAETLAALLREQPKAPSEVTPGVPRDLEKVILRCLPKDPDRRFQHMVDVKGELQEIKEESDSQPSAAQAPVRRRRYWLLAVALASASLLVVAAWLRWHPREIELTPPRLVPLTSMRGYETQPTFSPDGGQIAFTWDGEKGDNWDIYLKMIGSSEIHRLTTDSAPDFAPSWSPDGRQIAFVRSQPGSLPWDKGQGTIHLVSPELLWDGPLQEVHDYVGTMTANMISERADKTYSTWVRAHSDLFEGNANQLDSPGEANRAEAAGLAWANQVALRNSQMTTQDLLVRQMTRDLERFDQKKAADVAYYTYRGLSTLAGSDWREAPPAPDQERVR